MKENQDLKRDNITLKLLETKLRSFPEPDIPVTLKTKLLGTIPKEQIKTASWYPVRPGFGLRSFGATAAMISVLILIIILNFNSPVPSHKLVADINDGINNNLLTDLNTPFIEDINYVKDNIQQWNIERKGEKSSE